MGQELSSEYLHTLAQNVAPLLGDGWTYDAGKDAENRRHYASVKHTDGRGFTFGNSWPRGKVHVTCDLKGDLYQHKGYKEKLPSANLSPTKNPEAIAKDIVRRLLTDYTAIYVKALESLNNANDHKARTFNTLNAVCDLFGVRPRQNGRYDDKPVNSASWYDVEGLKCKHGEIETSGESITLKLSDLTLKQCEAIAKLLRK